MACERTVALDLLRCEYAELRRRLAGFNDPNTGKTSQSDEKETFISKKQKNVKESHSKFYYEGVK